MRSSGFAYVVAGVVLATGSGSMLAWANSASAVNDVVSETTATPALNANPVAPQVTPTAADLTVAGAAAEILRRADVGGTIQAGLLAPRPCGENWGGWHAADSARGVNGNVSVSIGVTAWRAGAAASEYRSLRETLSKCANVSETPGHDELSADVAVDTGAGRRSVGALRLGDTLTIVEVATTGPDSQSMVSRTLEQARTLLRGKLRDRCRSADSGDGGDHASRDPYGDHYSGRLIESRLLLGALNVRSDSESKQVSADRGTATWRPPTASPVNELAPLDLERIARAGAQGRPVDPSKLVDGFGQPLPRKEAPELINPSALIPPTDTRPDRDPGPAPQSPDLPPRVSIAEVPVLDPDGPGCGWEFTGVREPVVDPLRLTVDGRQAQIDRLSRDAARQADWLVATAAWPKQYSEWAVRKRAAVNWEEFEKVKSDEVKDWERAEEAIEGTVERRRKGDLPPVPTPKPTVSNPSPDSASAPDIPTPAEGPQ
ncbi:MAG: hypothetical protein Q8P61_09185 [Candidatus Nanopelagicales bacterium]|nr:hypothetical protein [Candidatus Nanopelagicales bacterium]